MLKLVKSIPQRKRLLLIQPLPKLHQIADGDPRVLAGLHVGSTMCHDMGMHVHFEPYLQGLDGLLISKELVHWLDSIDSSSVPEGAL